MDTILKAMKSEFGERWHSMTDVEQLGAIASFLKNYIPLNKSIILL